MPIIDHLGAILRSQTVSETLGRKTKIPEWAPRIKQSLIRRLYSLDAMGIYDDELIDDVGFTLWARCQSFIKANQATSGQAPCPVCEVDIRHNWEKEEILQCQNCGWELSWGDYFQTIQHKQLSGAQPVLDLFQSFVNKFPIAQTASEKMFLIDQLIHGFHWNAKYGDTRPVAINLIQGRLGDVIKFLDRLSMGEDSTLGIKETHERWYERSSNARKWAFKNKDKEI